MEIGTVFALAAALAMDAFAVAIAAGLALTPVSPRQVFRLSFHFGLFQFLMPILGWAAGRALADAVAAYDHWVALCLLWYIGGKMCYGAMKKEDLADAGDPTRGLSLVMLSVATSIDALAVGISMALLGVSVWQPAVIIGLVTALLCLLGMRAAAMFGPKLGHCAQWLGGFVLLYVGGHIVVSHL